MNYSNCFRYIFPSHHERGVTANLYWSSSDAKLERAAALGADDTINYKSNPDWEEQVLALTHGQGVDHVVELGGEGTLPHSYQAVGFGGEIALIGVLTRASGNLSPHPLMPKNATLRGIFVGGKPFLVGLLRAIEQNRIKPVVDSVFEFGDAAGAYEYLKSARHFGKVVIRI
jgi:NADPH:quinone reductase-like Zn-dependent oxidoreductase